MRGCQDCRAFQASSHVAVCSISSTVTASLQHDTLYRVLRLCNISSASSQCPVSALPYSQSNITAPLLKWSTFSCSQIMSGWSWCLNVSMLQSIFLAVLHATSATAAGHAMPRQETVRKQALQRPALCAALQCASHMITPHP